MIIHITGDVINIPYKRKNHIFSLKGNHPTLPTISTSYLYRIITNLKSKYTKYKHKKFILIKNNIEVSTGTIRYYLMKEIIRRKNSVKDLNYLLNEITKLIENDN